MRINKNHTRALVYAGAAFLDAKIGTQWRKKIDPERLALEDESACILGQTFGDYYDGLERLDISDDCAECLGFQTNEEHLDDDYARLDREWKLLLKRRST